MIHIFDTDLPENKNLFIALRGVYGIGKYQANKVCKKLGFSNNMRVRDLTDLQISEIIELLKSKHFIIEGDLKRKQSKNHAKLINIKSYRGLRKLEGLPIRGQRTHTNARSAKKNKRSIK